MHLLDIAHFVKSEKIHLMKHCQILDLMVKVQNCKIGTLTLMTSSYDVAWKMTSYGAETSAAGL